MAEAPLRNFTGLVHVSGLGADAASPSLYIRKRGEGELAVKAAFTDVILFRPAVMFGTDDAFLTTILELLRRLPIGRKRMPSRSSAAGLVCTFCEYSRYSIEH